MQSLKHVSFKYKGDKKKRMKTAPTSPPRRGLIFEEAPGSIQGQGKMIVIDERVMNAELAFKELARRLEDAEIQAAKLNEGGQP